MWMALALALAFGGLERVLGIELVGSGVRLVYQPCIVVLGASGV
jgi:hypothetical protein